MKQMVISVTQASNGFIQSVKMNRIMSPSNAVDLGRPCNTVCLNFRRFTDTFSQWFNFV